jgi:ABC-type phosphate/phosphonate transport system ATPase subunit
MNEITLKALAQHVENLEVEIAAQKALIAVLLGLVTDKENIFAELRRASEISDAVELYATHLSDEQVQRIALALEAVIAGLKQS